MAGMDENRTHPGRLNSAPQTVLKTAAPGSTLIRQRPHQFSRERPLSVIVRIRPQSCALLAVFLAV